MMFDVPFSFESTPFVSLENTAPDMGYPTNFLDDVVITMEAI